MERFPKSLISFQRMFPDEAACAAWLFSMRWPEGFQCPGCGHDHGWALPSQGAHLRMPQLPSPDLGDRGDDPSRQQARSDGLVLGGLSDGDPFERHLRPSAAEAARSRVLSHGLDAGRQTAPGDGRSRPLSGCRGWSRSDETSLPFRPQERPRRRRPRAKP